MKRRIYFLISGLIQMMISVYAIFTADKLANAMLDTLSIYPENMRARLTDLLQNSGGTYFIILAVICIVLNIFIIVWALNDKLVKNRGKVIGCSVASIFCAAYQFIELLAIINIIVMVTAKRERKEDSPTGKEKLPVLKREKVDKSKMIAALVLLIVYFSQFIWKDMLPEGAKIGVITAIFFYLTMIILSITLLFPLLNSNFKTFKEHFKAYIGNLMGDVGKFYLAYIVIALFASFLTKSDTSVNQTNIEAMPIWLSLPLAVIYAPIVEESLFRGCLRRFFKNDKVFIIISAISFGLLHTIFSEPNLYNAIVMGIPYMAIGGFLAYLYTKTNNMCTNMAFHAFHNAIVMIFVILIKGL